MTKHDSQLTAACADAQLAATPALTPRQLSELEFHRSHAADRAGLVDEAVARDIITPGKRRPWNAYWSMYDHIIAAGPAGQRVLIPGCGFGDDAIRLAMLGAKVSTFDLSPESVDIARERAKRAGHGDIDFRVMPAESMADYADASFDMVIFVDILHHVDIAATMAEVMRVIKPGGRIIGDELYTHSMLQQIRESALVRRWLYPAMQRWIYNGDTPYITPDEHKIDEDEFAIVRAAMGAANVRYFGLAEGRIFPSRMTWASRIDRVLMRLAGPLGKMLGSRVVFSGQVKG
jgi:ubiquinone/menaquinone biosynthesis C-methylase UbiE